MEKTICQIVDSLGGIPRNLIKKHDISEVPFYFKFEESDYSKENIDREPNFFFKEMEKDPKAMPQTLAPETSDWLSFFQEKYRQGYRDYIVTTISSELSNSYKNALEAKEVFQDENIDVRVEVIDSKTCATGQAAFEIWIADMIEANLDYGRIIQRIYQMIPKINTIFIVDDLRYIKASSKFYNPGRLLNRGINLKPISEFVDGKFHVIRNTIGRRKALKTMVDIAISRIENISKTTIIIQSARSKNDADYIHDYLRHRIDRGVEIFRSDLGITVGAHSGPGTVGIGFLEDRTEYLGDD